MINHHYLILKIKTSRKLTPFTHADRESRNIHAKEYILKVIEKLLTDAAS